MHPVVYYILFFIVLGGIGMCIANRKVEIAVQRQRWIKYLSYILITGTIITGIFIHIFFWLALIIILASLVELSKVNISAPVKRVTGILSYLVFLLVGAGFIFFAAAFNESFLLFIYFQVLVFDGFCQITGQLFGKHPLVPAISPSKTWEGLAGGWVCCIVAAYMAAGWLHAGIVTNYFGLFSGVLTGLTCFCGDLLASYYKRKARVKDYSNWLPGQGGFLDRFDSLLFTGAIYYLLYIVIFREGFSVFINKSSTWTRLFIASVG